MGSAVTVEMLHTDVSEGQLEALKNLEFALQGLRDEGLFLHGFPQGIIIDRGAYRNTTLHNGVARIRSEDGPWDAFYTYHFSEAEQLISGLKGLFTGGSCK